jgi:membrane-associated phospholipid phosphatase
MTLQHVLIAYLMVLVVIQALFAAFPGIDLAVSALFTDETRTFVWTEGSAPTVNLVVRRIGEAITILLVVGILYGVMTGTAQRDHLLVLAYPLLCVVTACGLWVNFLLKSHTGRARPDKLAEFGGTAPFTPPWQVVDHCARNCSFTSGEVAMAASLAIPAVVILWPHLSRTRSRLLLVLGAVAYVTFTSILRIGLGRHFVSDALFSILFAAGVAFAFYSILNIARARMSLPGILARRPAMTLADQRGVY